MATNTPHPVRSARRCISKFFFATAVAIATSSALAFTGALTTGPQVAGATTPAGKQTHALSGEAFGYPIKPFDQEHPIRANLGDPRMQFFGPPTNRTLMHGNGSFSFHQGVDISAPNGTAVYPVADGTVSAATPIWVRVTSGNRAFEYWHIKPLVRIGDHVNADQTRTGASSTRSCPGDSPPTTTPASPPSARSRCATATRVASSSRRSSADRSRSSRMPTTCRPCPFRASGTVCRRHRRC
jgi:hypothetical protein